jgi:hypothetical protein
MASNITEVYIVKEKNEIYFLSTVKKLLKVTRL